MNRIIWEYSLTHFTEMNHSSEANSCSAGQEAFRLS